MYKIRNRYRIFLMIIINKNQKNFPLIETFVYQIDQRKKKSSPIIIQNRSCSLRLVFSSPFSEDFTNVTRVAICNAIRNLWVII